MAASKTMYSTRDQIPRLPLPQLENTMRGYLEAVAPMLSERALQRTQLLAQQFMAGEGQALQSELERLESESETSWVAGFWDTMYLEARSPVPVDWNPAFQLRPDPLSGHLDQAQRAARLTHEATRVHQEISSGIFPADFEGADTPLHMLQHESLFASARVPRIGRDVLVQAPRSQHVVVLVRGHIYRLNVFSATDSTLLSEKLLISEMRHILKDSANRDLGPNLGLLTALNRDEWAKRHSELKSEAQSRALLVRHSFLLILQRFVTLIFFHFRIASNQLCL